MCDVCKANLNRLETFNSIGIRPVESRKTLNPETYFVMCFPSGEVQDVILFGAKAFNSLQIHATISSECLILVRLLQWSPLSVY